jgi:anti-sigma B factor antagonist
VQEFEVDVQSMQTCAVVSVRGELDIATAPQLVDALDAAGQQQAARVVVNLLGTTFVDSTGLTTLLRAHKQYQGGNDGAFSIVCGPDNLEVRRVIDLMGFNEVFTIHESLAAAGCDG